MRQKRSIASVHDLAERFQVLSDPTRLAVLSHLSAEPVCVCDLVAGLNVPQPLLSFHLRRLREAGLVTVTRRGRWSHYALAEESLGGLTAFLTGLTATAQDSATGACCAPSAAGRIAHHE